MAEIDWYYARGDVQMGPVPQAALRQLIATAAIGPGDLVWREGFAAWRPAGEIVELFPPQPPYRSANPPAAPSLSAMPPAYPVAPMPVGYSSMAYPVSHPTGQSYNGFAIAGFVLSLTFPLLGLIFSWIALNGMKKSGNIEGKGLATAGMIISSILVGLSCLYVIAIFTFLGAVAVSH